MLIKFLFLFTIAIIAVHGRISSQRIESDAATWAELHEKYMDRSAYGPFRGQFKTKCHIMRECCPDERVNFFDLMHQHKFQEACIGNRASSTFKSHSSKCQSSIQQLDNIVKSTDYAKFMKAMSGMPKSDERFRRWRSQMASVCSASELEAYYCEPEDMKAFESCQRKVLRLVARENDGSNYDAYVQEWKNDYATYIQRLSRVFTHF